VGGKGRKESEGVRLVRGGKGARIGEEGGGGKSQSRQVDPGSQVPQLATGWQAAATCQTPFATESAPMKRPRAAQAAS
jgi:hypothetical protein